MFTLTGRNEVADIFCDSTEHGCIHLAIADLAQDVEKAGGKRPLHKRFLPGNDDAYVLVGNWNNPRFRKHTETLGLNLATLDGKWEAYRIQTFGTNGQNLLLCGSDERGTMWAIYEFAEKFLGVDPVGFWTDHEPDPRQELTFDPIFIDKASPTFRYRGWFLNDEDLLSEWKNGGGARNIDYRFYHQIIHQDVFAKVVETALRLKQNLMIPASFLDIDNPAEENLVRMATERGLFVTQHHIEPLGVSHFSLESYWKKRGSDTPPSFVSNKEQVIETWTYYASKWAVYGNQVIWQLGLRGRGDRPVWGIDPNVPKTDAGRGALISDAMECQRRIVQNVTGSDSGVFSTTLWAEGTALHQAGHLRFPPGTIVVFADNLRLPSPIPQWRLYAHQWAEDFYKVERRPELDYGVYYHVAVWGSGPHLAQGVPLEKIVTCLSEAVEKGDTTYAITNVTNIREVILGVSAVAALTDDFPGFQAETFLARWCQTQFAETAESIQPLYQAITSSHIPIGSGHAAHPALVHDGVLRSQGKGLLLALYHETGLKAHDSLALMGQGLTHEQTASAANNTRDVQAVLDPHLKTSLISWRCLLLSIRETSPSIPENRRAFFEHHFRTQSEIMAYLTEWVIALSSALQAQMENQPRDRILNSLHDATHAMACLLTSREKTEKGRWQHWYRGDRKMDLVGCFESTMHLRDSYKNQGEFK